MIDQIKHPRTIRFLKEHPDMTLDDLLIWTENELKKLEKN